VRASGAQNVSENVTRRRIRAFALIASRRARAIRIRMAMLCTSLGKEFKAMTTLTTKLDAAKSHDIRELMNVLQANGCDNYTYAVCELAVEGELSPDTIRGLTVNEYRRLSLRYGTWNRDLAIDDALDAAMTKEG
jgi:hypothetical protein